MQLKTSIVLLVVLCTAGCTIYSKDGSRTGTGDTGSPTGPSGPTTPTTPTTPTVPTPTPSTDQPWTSGTMLNLITTKRGQYPTPMSLEQQGEMLAWVVCQTRNSRWGLSTKLTGRRVPVPGLAVTAASDVLAYRGEDPTKPEVHDLYDVLIDSDASAAPTFALIGPNRDNSRPWVRPTCN